MSRGFPRPKARPLAERSPPPAAASTSRRNRAFTQRALAAAPRGPAFRVPLAAVVGCSPCPPVAQDAGPADNNTKAPISGIYTQGIVDTTIRSCAAGARVTCIAPDRAGSRRGRDRWRRRSLSGSIRRRSFGSWRIVRRGWRRYDCLRWRGRWRAGGEPTSRICSGRERRRCGTGFRRTTLGDRRAFGKGAEATASRG